VLQCRKIALEIDGSVIVDAKAISDGNIRPRGQDVASGATILTKGSHIRAAEMGLLGLSGHQQSFSVSTLKSSCLFYWR
jgi:molybdopterin biosynthesis enzyme